jgi:hypothetical protein
MHLFMNVIAQREVKGVVCAMGICKEGGKGHIITPKKSITASTWQKDLEHKTLIKL